MWEGLEAVATEQALGFQARNPVPVPSPRPSFWSQAGEFMLAPAKGLGQAAAETGRKMAPVLDAYGKASAYANAAADDRVLARPSRDINQVRRETIEQIGNSEWIDAPMRRSLDTLKPDPVASTVASQVLQGGVRVISKALGYTAAGGPIAGILGTGFDEGVTEYQSLRDKHVDPATAAKVATVHGGATALGVALPVAGRSIAATLGLIAASGPGSYIAEQGLSKLILENANYPELAAEHDPFDLVGLGVSTLLPGVFGTLAHHARGRAAKAGEPTPAEPTATEPTPESRVAAMADVPEMRDAAHVQYADSVREVHNLGDRSDPTARAAHADALETARRALDNDEPVHVLGPHPDPERAPAVLAEFAQRLRALDEHMAAVRRVDDLAPADVSAAPAPLRSEVPAAPRPADAVGGEPQAMLGRVLEALGLRKPDDAPSASREADTGPLARAARVAEERPDLPIRLDKDGSSVPARDVLEQVREDVARNKTDAKAFEAAVECFLRTGS